MVGNILIAAASISYLGPFIFSYRNEMVGLWVEKCKEKNIPVAENFSLERILAEPVLIREWLNAGLPAD